MGGWRVGYRLVLWMSILVVACKSASAPEAPSSYVERPTSMASDTIEVPQEEAPPSPADPAVPVDSEPKENQAARRTMRRGGGLRSSLPRADSPRPMDGSGGIGEAFGEGRLEAPSYDVDAPVDQVLPARGEAAEAPPSPLGSQVAVEAAPSPADSVPGSASSNATDDSVWRVWMAKASDQKNEAVVTVEQGKKYMWSSS
jgi:hypothetical protein